MLAIRQHVFGGPEELRLEEVPDPHPADGQVRIRVESAGVNLIDASIRRGQTGGPLPPPELPMTPGREVAGVVDEIGSSIDERLHGCLVVTDLGVASGGYAELALARAESLHVIPEGLDADHAVAMIGTGRTTMAILELAAPTWDDVVVITAAAGGIGTLLVQAVRATGATVVGAAGGQRKVSLPRELGASSAVDYSQPGWPDAVRAALGGRPVTLALDGVGGDIGRTALELLGVGGRLVMFGSSSGTLIELSTGDLYRRGITVSAAIGARIMQRPGGHRSLESSALKAAAEGRLTPVIGQRFALADAAAAHEAIESRATMGKTVLRPLSVENEVAGGEECATRILSMLSVDSGIDSKEVRVGLSRYKVGAGLAVSDMNKAREFYEGKLGLSVSIDSGDNVQYRCAEGSVMHVYLSPEHAGKSTATLASWGVDDVERVVDELNTRGVTFERYDEGPIITDEKGIATFEGGAKVAYFRDPDGNTLSIAQAPRS